MYLSWVCLKIQQIHTYTCIIFTYLADKGEESQKIDLCMWGWDSGSCSCSWEFSALSTKPLPRPPCAFFFVPLCSVQFTTRTSLNSAILFQTEWKNNREEIPQHRNSISAITPLCGTSICPGELSQWPSKNLLVHWCFLSIGFCFCFFLTNTYIRSLSFCIDAQ